MEACAAAVTKAADMVVERLAARATAVLMLVDVNASKLKSALADV